LEKPDYVKKESQNKADHMQDLFFNVAMH